MEQRHDVRSCKIGVKFVMTQIIKLSDNAASRIKEIMSNAEKDALGVRISVKSGGCAGMSYVMEYTKEANPSDEVIEDKGVKVYIDSAAILYLLGTEMDYKKEEFSSSFVFNNPNETERCGCGESFKV
jgi:iron-sulfur cluster assembly protein